MNRIQISDGESLESFGLRASGMGRAHARQFNPEEGEYGGRYYGMSNGFGNGSTPVMTIPADMSLDDLSLAEMGFSLRKGLRKAFKKPMAIHKKLTAPIRKLAHKMPGSKYFRKFASKMPGAKYIPGLKPETQAKIDAAAAEREEEDEPWPPGMTEECVYIPADVEHEVPPDVPGYKRIRYEGELYMCPTAAAPAPAPTTEYPAPSPPPPAPTAPTYAPSAPTTYRPSAPLPAPEPWTEPPPPPEEPIPDVVPTQTARPDQMLPGAPMAPTDDEPILPDAEAPRAIAPLAPDEEKPFPWMIVAIAGGVVVLGVASYFLFFKKKKPGRK